MQSVLDRFRPGATIHLPGATGEVLSLAEALAADPDRMSGVHVVSCLLPGMNRFDYAALAADARLTTFLLPPEMRRSFADGRVRLAPLPYSGIARMLNASPPDVAVAHVAAPVRGRASFGIASDFSPIAWRNARTRIAIVNARMPSVPRSPSIDLADADIVVETDADLVEIPSGKPDAVAAAIATRAAALVPDGASLQVGVGAAPAAFWASLSDHRLLRLRSGMAAEPMLALADAGCLAGEGHLAGILAGGAAFYHSLAERDLVRLSDTLETHNAAAIGATPNFFAVNSALAVDLFGQVNLEWQEGRPVSGVGGAPDFVAGALASPGGRSITLLPATARSGSISRILPRLDAPAVSLPRCMADTVVTEHGVAELRHASLDERADALIGIAAPAWREELAREWRAMRARIN